MPKFNYVTAIRSIPMQPTTKAVAVILATYADYETGECYPTIRTLMSDTGLSNRVVSLHITKLEELGFLVVDRSRGRNSYYKFVAENISKAMTQSHQLRRVTSDFNDNKVVTLMQEVVTFVQKGVTQSHTNYQEQPLTTNEQPSICEQENQTQKFDDQVEQNNLGSEKPKAVKKPKSKKSPIPENFGISEQVQNWANSKGFNRIDQHLEHFIDKAIAKGYEYVDWDRAFMSAVREDWAKLNTQPQAKYQTSAQQTANEQAKWDQFLNGGNNFRDVTPKKNWMIEGVGHA